jgi:predicted transcriptional regulator
MLIRRSSIIIVILLAQVVATAGAAESNLIGAKAPEITLQDQYDRTISLRGFEGRVVVLIASDKKGKAQNPPWDKAIREKYGDIVVLLGVADVRSVPFFLKGKIRNDFKKEYAASVLMDWEGEIFTAFGLAEKVANVVVIDRSGTIRFLQTGPAVQDAVRLVFEEIDRLVRP